MSKHIALPMHATWHTATTSGRRAENQDRVRATPMDAAEAMAHGILLLVCDGVGGERGGGMAAEAAAEAAYSAYYRTPLSSPEQRLRFAVECASQSVEDEAERTRLTSMASTIVMAAVHGQVLHVAHVGDSRAYLWREGTLQQLTEDHVRQPRGEAKPRSAPLTRALGDVTLHQPDVCNYALRAGDRVLLCSDGLHRAVSEAELTRVLGQAATPEAGAGCLIQAALTHRSSDNVSVVLLFFGERTRARPSAHGWQRNAVINAMGAIALVSLGFALGWRMGFGSTGTAASAAAATSIPSPTSSGTTEPMATHIAETPTLVVLPTTTSTRRSSRPKPSTTATVVTPSTEVSATVSATANALPSASSSSPTPSPTPTETVVPSATSTPSITPSPSIADVTPSPELTPRHEEKP